MAEAAVSADTVPARRGINLVELIGRAEANDEAALEELGKLFGDGHRFWSLFDSIADVAKRALFQTANNAFELEVKRRHLASIQRTWLVPRLMRPRSCSPSEWLSAGTK
jgi:hypothetical protein